MEAPGAAVDSNAVGSRIDAPREVWSCGKGAVPPPQKMFPFLAQKGEFWCILGLIKPTFDRPGVSNFGSIAPRPPSGSAADGQVMR